MESIVIVVYGFGLAAVPTSESEISRFYTVLGHPLRRDIIKIVGEAGSASFTDLRSTLKASVGTLYYNIDLMEGLVSQDESKRYVLTPRGDVAYRFLVESEEKLVSLGVKAEEGAGWFSVLSRAFTMRSLFFHLYQSPKLSLPSALTILIYGAWVTYQAQLFPVMVLYSEKQVLPPFCIPFLFVGGWGFVNVLGNLVPSILYGRPKEGAGCLLIGSCYALLPSLALPTVWVVHKSLYLPLSLVAAQSIMLLSMGYTLCLLTTAISLAKGLRTEKAALASMVILYITVGLFLIFLEL